MELKKHRHYMGTNEMGLLHDNTQRRWITLRMQTVRKPMEENAGACPVIEWGANGIHIWSVS